MTVFVLPCKMYAQTQAEPVSRARQSYPFFSAILGFLLLSSPAGGRGAEPVGVARASGPAEVNGMRLPGDTNVFSGDRLCTQRDAVLTLASSPQESLQLAPESCVRVTKEAEKTLLALERGALSFESAGAAQVVFETYRIRVLSKPGFQTVADVSWLNPREAQACVVRGWVEVARVGQQAINQGMVLLGGGQSGLLALDRGEGAVVVGTGACPPANRKAALAALGVAGGAAAIALPLLLRDDGPVSPSVP